MYPLTVALPHTNHNQLAEFLFLMHAGNFQWTSISRLLGIPLSQLRTIDGGEVYATFNYIEEDFPPSAPMNGYRLDDECIFLNHLRAFKNMAVDGRLILHRRDALPQDAQKIFAADPGSWKGKVPYLRMANVFITPVGGNEFLKMAPPANVSFNQFPPLPNRENAFHILREVERSGRFSTIGEDFMPFDRREEFSFLYVFNPDRDTNGAGLVYFANYIAFMDMAERKAMTENALEAFTQKQVDFRTLRRREIGYFGNARLDDTVRIHVRMFRRGAREVGFRYRLERGSDKKLIAISESIKNLPE